MAELQIEGDEVLLHLSRSEKLEAIHGDLRAPLTAIRPIEVLNDAHEPADHGFKVGERLPGISEVATVRTEASGSSPSFITTGREVYASCSRARIMTRGSSELPIPRKWRPGMNRKPGASR